MPHVNDPDFARELEACTNEAARQLMSCFKAKAQDEEEEEATRRLERRLKEFERRFFHLLKA